MSNLSSKSFRGNRMNIPAVVLDCDFRSQEGVIQPLGRCGVSIVAVSSDAECPAFRSKYIFHKFISPHLDDGEEQYIDFLIKLPIKGVLVYSNDVCAVTVSKYKRRLQEAGFLLNIANLTSLENTFDKWNCYELAKSLNIPMARTKLVESIDDVYTLWDSLHKPVILKGTRLAGGMYYKLNHRDQIPFCWAQISNIVNSSQYVSRKSQIIMQEWHQYDMTDNWSCETVYDKDGEPMGFFTIKRIRCSLNKDGTFSSRLFAGHYEECPKLVERTQKILSSMQWRGFAHVEYFYVPDKGDYLLTEVNPRLPGYSYYPGAAGFNMAHMYYANLVGKDDQIAKLPFPESIYFEAFHFPGDLTEGFTHILRGNIGLFSFLSSYLRLFTPGLIRILDPIRIDDPKFSFYTQCSNVKFFYRKTISYIKRRILKLRLKTSPTG